MPDDDDSQMWKPPDAAKAVTVGQMFTLAKRLRSKAYWSGDPYYDDANASLKNSAINDALTGFADELDSVFGFDSNLTTEECKRR